LFNYILLKNIINIILKLKCPWKYLLGFIAVRSAFKFYVIFLSLFGVNKLLRIKMFNRVIFYDIIYLSLINTLYLPKIKRITFYEFYFLQQ